jgi:PhoPQ-activated pathogenicity-related protein
MPSLSWEIDQPASGDHTLTIQANPAPISARLWSASSASRDFRESKWSPSTLTPGNTIRGSLSRPDSGKHAAFAELEYEIDGIPYHLSTTFFEPGIKPTNPNSGKP